MLSVILRTDKKLILLKQNGINCRMKKLFFGISFCLSVLIMGLIVFPVQTSFSQTPPNTIQVTEDSPGIFRVHITDPDGILSASILDETTGNNIGFSESPICPDHIDDLLFQEILGHTYSVVWTDCNGIIDSGPLPPIILDSDNDGVPDDVDQCPGIDDTIDVDVDSIPDCIDSIIDSDNDGVPDDTDQCPDTPVGTLVDSVGCERTGDEKKSCEALEKENNGKAKGKERAKENNNC